MQNMKDEKLAPAIEGLWKVAKLYKEKIDSYSLALNSVEKHNEELAKSLEDNKHTLDLQDSKLNEFEAKIKSLEEVITKQRAELSTLGNEFSSTQEYKDKYEALLVEFDKHKLISDQEQINTNAELSTKSKELETTQNDYTFLQKELSRRTLELIERDEIISKHKESIAELQNKVYQSKDAERKINENIEKISNLEEIVIDVTKQRDELFQKLNDVKSNQENDKLSIYKEELERQAELIRNFNTKNASFQQEKSELIAKIANLEIDLAQLKDSNISNSENLIQELEAEKQNLKLQLDEANLKVKQFGAVSVASHTSMEQQAGKIRDLEHKAQLHKQVQADLVYKVEQEQTRANKFQELIARYEEDLISKSKVLGELERENSELKTELQKSTKIANDNNSNDSEEAKLEIALLTEEIANLELRIASAIEKEDFEKILQENDKLKNNVMLLTNSQNDFESEKNVLNALIQNKENLISESKALNELYQLKNTQLVSALMEKERKIEEFNLLLKENSNSVNLQEVKNLQDNISDLNSQIQSRDASIGKLQEKLNELEVLIKVRYDQIEILGEQLNKQNLQKQKDKVAKADLVTKIENYIERFETLIQ